MNVIVVEDEVIIRQMLTATLKHMNCIVVGETGSGEEAVELLRRHNNVDLVCMDITLHGSIDGVEAVRRMSSFTDVPVVFISAYQKSSVKVTGNVAGYLTKPINNYEFQKVVDSVKIKQKRVVSVRSDCCFVR